MVGKSWSGAVNGFTNKMRSLSEAMQTFGDEDNVPIQQELLMTCCTGGPTDSVHTFLTTSTSPPQLTRIERQLLQAFDYVNLVVCTRLQAAGHHLLTILNELQASSICAEKFRAVGLQLGCMQNLMALAHKFIKLTELLLIQCSHARRFVQTLFQVLLRTSQRLQDQSASNEGGANCPSKEDMDDFIGRMQQQPESLELVEVTRIIGACTAATSPRKSNLNNTEPTSLMEGINCFCLVAERLGEQIVKALSATVGVLACTPVHVTSPWASISGAELKTSVVSVSNNALISPLSLAWEALGDDPGACLRLLWCGGGRESELHICRVWVSPAPPGAPQPARLQCIRLRAGRLFLPSKQAIGVPLKQAQGSAHFMLSQTYDSTRVVALVLQEQPNAPSRAFVTVCFLDLSNLEYSDVTEFCTGATGASVDAVSLEDFPESCISRSVALPESYIWASAMHVMATRGVCSIYALRARRLLTLGMGTHGEKDDKDDTGDKDGLWPADLS